MAMAALANAVPSSGELPPHWSASAHEERVLKQLRSKNSSLEQNIFLNGLKLREPSTYYKLLVKNMAEITPIIYTPTVGEVCQKYSLIWRRSEGLYVSFKHKGKIRQVLESWPGKLPRIAVVTDGSRILGLGDLGANGLPICLGKLDLYIAGAGINPSQALPICIDLGTNNEEFLKDPVYIGLRQKRPSDSEAREFMDEFMSAMKTVFPDLLIQFEDFATNRAFEYLDAYRYTHRVFNDDIQGTGAVVLSGFVNAARLSSKASGKPLNEHRILFYGAGSAGIGVAKQLLAFFPSSMTEDQKKAQIWTVDSQGLITVGRKNLQEHKKYFARTDYQGPPLKNLVDIVNYVKPTALIGLSTVRNAFSQEVVEAMAFHNPRPIIFPLSNPFTMCELDFEDALKWTRGTVIFSSGSPYKPLVFDGKERVPGQGNNMYQFPAIGLGTILSNARIVTDSMIEAAAFALANSLDSQEEEQEFLYPRLPRIREISIQIAFAVIRAAQNERVDEATNLRSMTDFELRSFIKGNMWSAPSREAKM